MVSFGHGLLQGLNRREHLQMPKPNPSFAPFLYGRKEQREGCAEVAIQLALYDLQDCSLGGAGV